MTPWDTRIGRGMSQDHSSVEVNAQVNSGRGWQASLTSPLASWPPSCLFLGICGFTLFLSAFQSLFPFRWPCVPLQYSGKKSSHSDPGTRAWCGDGGISHLNGVFESCSLSARVLLISFPFCLFLFWGWGQGLGGMFFKGTFYWNDLVPK